VVLLILALTLVVVGLFTTKVLLGAAFALGMVWVVARTRPVRRSVR
jgi:hypothetical protein